MFDVVKYTFEQRPPFCTDHFVACAVSKTISENHAGRYQYDSWHVEVLSDPVGVQTLNQTSSLLSTLRVWYFCIYYIWIKWCLCLLYWLLYMCTLWRTKMLFQLDVKTAYAILHCHKRIIGEMNPPGIPLKPDISTVVAFLPSNFDQTSIADTAISSEICKFPQYNHVRHTVFSRAYAHLWS